MAIRTLVNTVGFRHVIGVCILTLALSLQARPAAGQSFDFNAGNAPIEVIIPTAVPLIQSSISSTGSDATIILRITTLATNAWFDAIAPYHPTAVGVYSRLGRRPASEGATNRARNIAILYATLRIFNSLMPQHTAQWRDMLMSLGLNPDDTREDTITPVGIGNKAGNAVLRARIRDGMNQLGDEGGRTYNRRPYADYLGYRPVNTADVIHDPSRWQPDIRTSGNGLFLAQQFVTPQMGITDPYSYRNPNQFRIPPPTDSDFARNPGRYRAQADDMLAVSAGLTDQQKLMAEHFNNKFASLGGAAVFISLSRGFTLEQFVIYDFLTNVAAFDAAIAGWSEKLRYDAVRPFTAIRFLYRNRRVTAWGGPGRGTVNDITGSEWRAYLNTADHPEYPSGSAMFCAAHAQASRRFLGSDTLGHSVPIAQGASVVEPGVTPATDIVLGPWETFTEWENECRLSRVWGGVHFRPAGVEGAAVARRIGDRAFEFVRTHVQGRGR